MKNKKKLLILAGALVVTGAALYLLNKYSELPEPLFSDTKLFHLED